MDIKVVKNIEEFADLAEKNQEVYYLTNENDGIEEYLENSGLNGSILINIKLAYNIKFNGFIFEEEYQNKKDVSSIEDVVKKLDNNFSKQKLILKFGDKNKNLSKEDKKLFTNIIQQFIFLGLDNLKIFTEQDLKNENMYKNFQNNSHKIKESLSNFELEISKYKTNNKDILKSKDDLYKHIEEINNIIKKTEKRKLIVSVVAQRNAGKSVIVNSFLNEEYAPTSLEDSTPNAVIYEAWDKDYIQLRIEKDEKLEDYKEEIIKKFYNVKELHQYMTKTFKNINKDSDEGYMPDIYIYYPKKESSLDYIIVDTPGPNKTIEHEEASNKWIKKSDALMFAIQYGDNEEKNALKFLEDVQLELSKSNKLESLLIVANKLDIMYTTEHSKSKVRYLDKSISFLNKNKNNIPVVMIASSALEYFYIHQFKKLLKEKNSTLNSNKIRDLMDDIEDNRLFNNDKEITIKTFIETQALNLSNSHGFAKSRITIDDIVKHSNMENVINRVEYIAKNKAFSEIFANLFSQLDMKFTSLENEFLAKEIFNLQERKEDILKDLNEIDVFFKEKKKEIQNKQNYKELKNNIIDIINHSYNTISKEFKDKISSNFSAVKYDIVDGKTKCVFLDKMIDKETTNLLSQNLRETIDKFNETKDDYVNQLEYEVMEINDDIQDKMNEYDFKNKYSLDIKLSDLSPKLAKERYIIRFDSFIERTEKYKLFNSELGNIMKTEEFTKHITKTKEVLKDGFFNKFLSFWGGGYETVEYTEEVTDTREVIDEDLVQIKLKEIEKAFMQIISDDLDKNRELINNELMKQCDNIFKIAEDELNNVIQSYNKTNNNIKKMLNEDNDIIENKIEFFQTIENDFNKIKELITLVKKG